MHLPMLTPAQSGTQSYLVAGILSRVACQHRELSRLLIVRTLSPLMPVRFFDLIQRTVLMSMPFLTLLLWMKTPSNIS